MPSTTTNQIRVRPRTGAKLKAFGKARRLKLVEVVDVAINALNSLPKEQQERLIEGKPIDPPAPAVAN